jgi:adenine C2-methylase RlmN of 23S rRNA A2503 and tRNA A37
VQALRQAAVPVTVRKEKGQEVAAACGQLRRHASR